MGFADIKMNPTKQHRRNGDKWYVKAVQIVVFTFTPMAVGMTVYVFSNFATIHYVDAENMKQERLVVERQKRLEDKIDMLIDATAKLNNNIKENTHKIDKEIDRDRDRRGR